MPSSSSKVLLMVARYIQSFWKLIYIDVCVCCGQQLIEGEQSICLKCYHGLSRTDFHLAKENGTSIKFLGRVKINAATSRFHYKKDSLVQRAIKGLKYYRKTQIGTQLGIELGKTIRESELFGNIDFIIPVPLHPNKHRKRGYNQSEIIANGINQVLKCTVRTDLISRIKNTKSQTGIRHIFIRWRNVDKIFISHNHEQLIGKHVLIVDDVITTGATIENCIKTIENVKDIKISIASLANTSN